MFFFKVILNNDYGKIYEIYERRIRGGYQRNWM